jgi:hypothetical protein
MSDLYDRDFYAQTDEQATLLRAGGLSRTDIVYIAKEIESMGQRAEPTDNRLAVLLAHLLKWQFQPMLRGNSWRLTIREQRRLAGRVLTQNYSLRGSLNAVIADAYGEAVLIAARETGLEEAAFPAACP